MIKEMNWEWGLNCTTTPAHHFNSCGCHTDWEEYGENFVSSGVLLVLGYETSKKVIFLYGDNRMGTASKVAGYPLDEGQISQCSQLLWMKDTTYVANKLGIRTVNTEVGSTVPASHSFSLDQVLPHEHNIKSLRLFAPCNSP
jgi:hypothetical protein